jgi:DNA-binding CsgD family transcriptional regulator
VLRAQRCRQWRSGHPTEGKVELVTGGIAAMRDRLHRLSDGVREIIGVSTAAESVQVHVDAHRHNERLLRRGTRMLSVFDTSTMTAEVRDFLASEGQHPYLLAYAPVQVRVLDRDVVVLEGPLVEGERSLLLLRDPQAVRAALRYVGAARRAASPVRATDDPGGLSARQRVVARLLVDGRHDEEIAQVLGVSVRTVRYEVAAIMAATGGRTRFAAGARLAGLLDP